MLQLFSVNHHDHDLAAVEALSTLAHGDLEHRVCALENVDGALVLDTCNRIEVLIDTTDASATAESVQHLFSVYLSNKGATDVTATRYDGEHVITHLFELACGLKSMVVGEREITGQVRHALRRAQREGTSTGRIIDSIDSALRTARIVERETGLSSMGRSVASIGMDQAGQLLNDFADITVTMFGTGSYAGAAVTQLKDRGCHNIFVHSSSGRAELFAHGRGLTPIRSDQLADTLVQTDLIVSCRGIGSPTITADHVRERMNGFAHKQLVVLDLAIVRDVDPSITEIPGVHLIDLEAIQASVPELSPERTARAHEIVDEQVALFLNNQQARTLDPAIIALREITAELIDHEMSMLPQRELTSDDVRKSLHRLSNRMLHRPIMAAHAAGYTGTQEEYVQALSRLTGLEVSYDVNEE